MLRFKNWNQRPKSFTLPVCFKKGQPLIHAPTRRPVVVAEVDERGFTVYTLDDTWIDPKTGEMSGGSAWRLTWGCAGKFEKVEV